MINICRNSKAKSLALKDLFLFSKFIKCFKILLGIKFNKMYFLVSKVFFFKSISENYVLYKNSNFLLLAMKRKRVFEFYKNCYHCH